MKSIYLIPAALILFASCKKDHTINPDEKGSLTVEFDNIAGSADLQLNTATYTNATGESFKVTKFDYYISNIRLKKTDGTEYVVPQEKSYFLVKESETDSREPSIDDIPAGDYNQVTFTVGVDSTRCTADISQRTGVLDPSSGGLGMYWSWNSGYIFLKMEGTSPQSALPNNIIEYHIGGFGGYSSSTINNIKTITLSLPQNAMVRESRHPQIHLLVDVLKVVSGSTNISFASHPSEHFTPYSVNVANNYQQMFTVDHVHND